MMGSNSNLDSQIPCTSYANVALLMKLVVTFYMRLVLIQTFNVRLWTIVLFALFLLYPIPIIILVTHSIPLQIMNVIGWKISFNSDISFSSINISSDHIKKLHI